MRSRKGGMIKGSSIHKHVRYEEKLKLQREGYKNLEDGRSPSSAFQHTIPPDSLTEHDAKEADAKHKEEVKHTDDNKHVDGALKDASPLKQGVVNFLTGGLLGNKDKGPQELLEGTGKTVEKVTGMKISGEGDEGDITAEGEGVETVPPVEDEEAIV